jgi:hypothetical protein
MALIAVFALASLAATAGSASAFSTTQVQVSATSAPAGTPYSTAPTSTGITLAAGEQAVVSATGTWCGGPGWCFGPAGSGSQGSCANPGACSVTGVDNGALIGSLNGSSWFGIGAGPKTITGPGTLLLGENDDYHGDNSGSVTATVSPAASSGTPTLVNPGFETGNLSGWSSDGGTNVTSSYEGYTAPDGRDFSYTLGGCSTHTLSQSFSANAGDTLSGWAFFKANDYLPFNDSGSVQLTVAGGGSSAVVFSSNVNTVGSFGETPWKQWSYSFPATGTYTLKVQSTNNVDCSVPSAVGLDLPAAQPDTTPPSVAVSHSADGQGGWNVTSPVTETVTASDSGSGLAGSPSCTVDGNGATLTAGGSGTWTFSVSGDGQHAVSCTASDSAGNQAGATDTVKMDSAAPSTSASGVPSGWVNHDVTVSLSASDQSPGSGVAATYYSVDGGQTQQGDSVTVAAPSDHSDDGTHQVSYWSVDNAGNTEAKNTATVEIDTTQPVVTYTGNAGSYTVADSVSIACSASDPTPGSGMASDTCQNISGDGYTFALGANSYSATGTDNAGNVGHGQTAFTVTVDTDSLCTLTKRWVTNPGIASALCAKLGAAKASIARGDTNSKNGQLDAYRNQLSAQSGKSITAEKAAILTKLSQAI